MNTIQDDLKKLSRQIQEYEKSYLEDTMYYGNVVIGLVNTYMVKKV